MGMPACNSEITADAGDETFNHKANSCDSEQTDNNHVPNHDVFASPSPGKTFLARAAVSAAFFALSYLIFGFTISFNEFLLFILNGFPTNPWFPLLASMWSSSFLLIGWAFIMKAVYFPGMPSFVGTKWEPVLSVMLLVVLFLPVVFAFVRWPFWLALFDTLCFVFWLPVIFELGLTWI